MQLWNGSVYTDRAADCAGDEQDAYGNGHGSGSAGEYSSFWNVQFSGKSDSGSSYRRRIWGIDADAVYSGHPGAMDAGQPGCFSGRETLFKQYLQMYVRLWGSDPDSESGNYGCSGTVDRRRKGEIMERNLINVIFVLLLLILVLLCRIWVLSRSRKRLKKEQEQLAREAEGLKEREDIYRAMLPAGLLNLFQKGKMEELRIGEEKNIRAAVLSFNVFGFSQMVRSQTAEQIFSFVNRVLEQVVPGVLFQDGEIERYVDAGLRAFYLEEPERALCSAVSICEAMNRQKDIQQKYAIGLSYGSVMAGVAGHEKRFGVLTISDTTGIAEFLRELAGRYGAHILITGSLKERIPDFEKKYNSRYVGCIYLKVMDATEDIYDVYDGDDPVDRNGKHRTRLLFEKGVELYQSQRFYDARLHFIEVLKANRMDGAAKEYLYLCNQHEAKKEKEVPAYLEIY